MKKLDDLYILNMNEAAMAIDEDVNVEMERLCTEATLEIIIKCLDPLRAKKTFIRKNLGHTMVSAIKASSTLLCSFI